MMVILITRIASSKANSIQATMGQEMSPCVCIHLISVALDWQQKNITRTT